MKELHQVVAAKSLDDKHIHVVFENGAAGVFDCSRYMTDKYWRPLSDPAFFRLVRVECGTLVWPGDIDIDPEEIWEDCEKKGGSVPDPGTGDATLFVAEPAEEYDAVSPD